MRRKAARQRRLFASEIFEKKGRGEKSRRSRGICMQSGCSCRKENKDGNPKANRSIKKERDSLSFFMDTPCRRTHPENLFVGKSNGKGVSH